MTTVVDRLVKLLLCCFLLTGNYALKYLAIVNVSVFFAGAPLPSRRKRESEKEGVWFFPLNLEHHKSINSMECYHCTYVKVKMYIRFL